MRMPRKNVFASFACIRGLASVMNIQDKIEEIRRKPEHIRLRYVWAMTAASAILIIIIWAVSFQGQPEEKDNASFSISEEQKEVINNLKEQKKSIQDAAGQMKDVLNNPVEGEGFDR